MLVIITGTSASGKTTLMNLLQYVFDNTGFVKAVTTRAPRPDDSSEYEYISSEEFQKLITNKELVSWRKASTNEQQKDDYYGVKFSAVERSFIDNAISIRSVTPENISDWYRYFGEKTVFIHLLAPTKAEARRRMHKRGGLSEPAIEKRIQFEKNWDQDVRALKENGILIHLIPAGALKNVFFKVSKIILNSRMKSFLKHNA